MKDMSKIMTLKPIIFRYLTNFYGDLKIYTLCCESNGQIVEIPENIYHGSSWTEELQQMFNLDIRTTNDILNQWFRRTYHIDLFSENKTKILQRKLKRWGK